MRFSVWPAPTQPFADVLEIAPIATPSVDELTVPDFTLGPRAQ